MNNDAPTPAPVQRRVRCMYCAHWKPRGCIRMPSLTESGKYSMVQVGKCTAQDNIKYGVDFYPDMRADDWCASFESAPNDQDQRRV